MDLPSTSQGIALALVWTGDDGRSVALGLLWTGTEVLHALGVGHRIVRHVVHGVVHSVCDVTGDVDLCRKFFRGSAWFSAWNAAGSVW